MVLDFSQIFSCHILDKTYRPVSGILIFLILILFGSNEYITGGLGVSWLVVNLIQMNK